jgi:hypothetical protein
MRRSSMLKALCLAAVVMLALPAARASANDPFVGKWKLDVRQSRYPARACPRSMEIEMRPAEGGVWYQSDATYGNGGGIHAQYTAKYDGKEVLVSGTRGLLLPVSLKRLSSHIVVATYARGMQVVATSKRVVSADGRVMTITTTSIDASGKKASTLGVYRRE